MVPGLVLAFTGGAALAAGPNSAQGTDGSDALSLSLAYSALQDDGSGTSAEECEDKGSTPDGMETPDWEGDLGYREISDFFNVREANANVRQGEWEWELEGGWSTGSGGDDDGFFASSIKYGYMDELFIELDVLPIEFGDGGDRGAGDLGLTMFWQFAWEYEWTPAMALWASMRAPTGDGSEKIDGEVHFNVTRTLAPKFRGHLEGFVLSANGARDGSEDVRRHFQWGAGGGFDYQFSDATIGTINYLHTSSQEYGHKNNHVVQVGVAHKVAENQTLKLALDFGVDGLNETPNVGAKLQWALQW